VSDSESDIDTMELLKGIEKDFGAAHSRTTMRARRPLERGGKATNEEDDIILFE